MFKISDELHFSFQIIQILDVPKFLQMKQRLPFWELTYGHSLFVKVKRELDVLPPAHGAKELHITRENYQAKIWLQADHVLMDLENKPTEYINLWQSGAD